MHKSIRCNISDDFNQVPTQLGPTERTIISFYRVGFKDRSVWINWASDSSSCHLKTHVASESEELGKANAEALVVATKEIGLEVNADKTKYMVTSREQTAGLSHTMKVDNRSIEWVEEFKYLGTTLTSQNYIQEEIKSRLKLGNACCHSVQNILSSSLLSKYLKININRTIILSVV